MAKEILQYTQMVEEALRAIVRRALTEVAEFGLPGNHHFYITFRTSHPGVEIADHLKARYPAEMTIVLQYQYYDLIVGDSSFAVTLSFNNAPERLVIPFSAITVFADPSANFALPFTAVESADESAAQSAPKSDPADGASAPDKGAAVVSLDQFRRK